MTATTPRIVTTLPEQAVPKPARRRGSSPSAVVADELVAALIGAPLDGGVRVYLPNNVTARDVRAILRQRICDMMPAKTATFYRTVDGDYCAAIVARMTTGKDPS